MALCLFVHDAAPERLRSALAVAAAAAASGEVVTLVWEGEALRALSEGSLACSHEAWPEGVDSPAHLHAALCDLPSVRQLACPTAILAAGLSPETVAPHVDAIEGLATILARVEDARLLYV